MAQILVIEDEENLRLSIGRRLGKAGHEVAEASDAAGAWQRTREVDIDLVLTDINLGGGETGVELLKRLRADGFEGVIIVMTAYGTVENAVQAMRDGADDYLQKPISLEELTLQAERWLEQRRAAKRLRLYERLQRTEAATQGIVGKSEAWTAAMEVAERLAQLPIPNGAPTDGLLGGAALPSILLLGETGVGKGVLARHIHQRATSGGDESSETESPFVHVNCSALPATLVESELFGHEKGAFTDAKAARAGLFEMAEGGTIFLDEIGEMPTDLQAKLLLVVEQGSYRRVGGSKERRVRARLIVATNQDLEKRCQDGGFRRDLYYRLNAFTISIPPLRERGADVDLLADAMLERFSKQFGRGETSLSALARAAVHKHDWPGNVRELANAIQRAVMLTDDAEIGANDLGLSARATRLMVETASNGDVNGLVFDFERGIHCADAVEKALIQQALEHAKGNVSKAAKLIGMNRSSFRYRLERSGLIDFAQEIANR